MKYVKEQYAENLFDRIKFAIVVYKKTFNSNLLFHLIIYYIVIIIFVFLSVQNILMKIVGQTKL